MIRTAELPQRQSTKAANCSWQKQLRYYGSNSITVYLGPLFNGFNKKISGMLLAVGIFVCCACFFIGLLDLPLAESQSRRVAEPIVRDPLQQDPSLCDLCERLLRFWLWFLVVNGYLFFSCILPSCPWLFTSADWSVRKN